MYRRITLPVPVSASSSLHDNEALLWCEASSVSRARLTALRSSTSLLSSAFFNALLRCCRWALLCFHHRSKDCLEGRSCA